MEKWVQNFENHYIINEFGEVFSCKFNKRIRIKPYITHNGYEKVNLYKDGKQKKYTIHRLVAEAFLEKPKDKNQVNHKDGNKRNNHLSNLEWVTGSENILHAIETGLKSFSYMERPLVQIDKKTEEILDEFKSMTQVEELLNIKISGIYKCCIGKRKTAGGYIWKYKEDCSKC